MNGQQMAAAMAMAAGAWCGSVWLNDRIRITSCHERKNVEANSSQTIRSKSRTESIQDN